MALGIFQKAFFPKVTSQVTISQLATSQICNFPGGNFPMVRLDLLRCRTGCKGGQALWLEQARGPSSAARTDLGRWRLGNCTAGKLLVGKISLGSRRLGKAFGKNLTSHISYYSIWHIK